MSTNGTQELEPRDTPEMRAMLLDTPATDEDTRMLADVRALVLREQRQAIIKEREGLIVRYRVRKRLNAPAKELAELITAMEECEVALLEVQAIADEWRAASEPS